MIEITPLRAAVIEYVRVHPGCSGREIMERGPRHTDRVYRAARELREAGILRAEPGTSDRRNGKANTLYYLVEEAQA